MTRLYVLSWKDVCTEPKDYLVNYLSPERLKKYKSFRFRSDKNNCLYSYLLLKKEMSFLFAIPVDRQLFENDIYGKPYLAFPHNKAFFNISHTDGCVICAISDSEVGVDIEKITSIPEDIIKDTLSESEKRILASFNESEQALRAQKFFSFWTRKEAYVKYTGRGINDKFNLLDTESSKFSKCHTFLLNEYCISIYCNDIEFKTIQRSLKDINTFYGAQTRSVC